MIIVGAALLVVFSNNQPIATLAAALLGAGFTILISNLVGGQAIHEQYAKDANLRRRDTAYAPLWAELHYVQEKLTEAGKKQAPYPIVISSAEDEDVIVPHWSPESSRIQLATWLSFRASSTHQDFTEDSQQLFDTLLTQAEGYTLAVQETRDPVIQVLARHIDEAVEQTKATKDFQHWQEEYERPERRSAPLGQYPPSARDWYARLLQPTSGPSFGDGLAKGWLYNSAAVHGWILAQAQQPLVEALQKYFQPSSDPPPPPQEWIAEIVFASWSELEALPACRDARQQARRLRELVNTAVNRLTQALQEIQDRYEGGRPLV